MSDKKIVEMQKEVDQWVNQFEKPYFEPLSMLAAMVEEMGEIARVVNTLYGDKKSKKGEDLKLLEEEIGDLLFSMICLANSEKIDLGVAFERKMEKVTKRDSDRWERKGK